MEMKEAIATARAMENHYRAFAKISEFLKASSEILRAIDGAEKKLVSLTKDVEGMGAKKVAMESEMAQKKKDFDLALQAERLAVLKDATQEAEAEAIRIKAGNQSLIGQFSEKKRRLESEIGELSSRKAQAADKMEQEIKGLSINKAALVIEVSQLTEAKATLEKEMQAMKERVGRLLS